MPYVGTTAFALRSAGGDSQAWTGSIPVTTSLYHEHTAVLAAVPEIPEYGQVIQVDVAYDFTYRCVHSSGTVDRSHTFGITLRTATGGEMCGAVLMQGLTPPVGTEPFTGTATFASGVGGGLLSDGTIPGNWYANPVLTFGYGGTDVGPWDGSLPDGTHTYNHDCEVVVNSVDLTIHYMWDEFVEYPVTGALVETRRLFSY